MTPIQDIMTRLETATNPVAQAIHKGDHFKVLAIGFKKGMIMKDHKAALPAKLTVLSGSVCYKMNGVETILSAFDEQIIPLEKVHSVEAMENSLCLLTQG